MSNNRAENEGCLEAVRQFAPLKLARSVSLGLVYIGSEQMSWVSDKAKTEIPLVDLSISLLALPGVALNCMGTLGAMATLANDYELRAVNNGTPPKEVMNEKKFRW